MESACGTCCHLRLADILCGACMELTHFELPHCTGCDAHVCLEHSIVVDELCAARFCTRNNVACLRNYLNILCAKYAERIERK